MKTFIIESFFSEYSHMELGVILKRKGKVFKKVYFLTDYVSEKVNAFWALRKQAEKLGATHVRILGKREPI